MCSLGLVSKRVLTCNCHLKYEYGVENMYKEPRLPQNAKEGIIFMLIISIISVNTIAPTIMFLERGFSWQTYKETLTILPIMWIVVLILVRFVAGPIIGKVSPKFIGKTDGFNSRVLWNIFLNVTTLSILLTIIGSWIGMREISLHPIENFFHIWPRNFGIALWIEALIAQPIARFAMKQIHARQDRKAAAQA